jgi:hypothetical protein
LATVYFNKESLRVATSENTKTGEWDYIGRHNIIIIAAVVEVIVIIVVVEAVEAGCVLCMKCLR